jgi:hypothetical protein
MGYSLFTSDPFTYPGGGIAAGVRVSVYFAATSVHAPIFHDDLGMVSKTNPARTDDFGRVSFWIEPGIYVLSANGVRSTVTVDPIPDPPGPEDYVTRTEVEGMIADAGGSSLPPVTTKGQLYAALGAASVGLLSAGTDGQVLSADSAAATGLRWIAAAGGGGAVASVFGRTGAVTAQAGDYTKTQVGLANVDNTSDASKPVSTLQAAADAAVLAASQPLDSDLTALAALTPTNDDIVQRKAGAWTNRTIAQLKTDLGGLGTAAPKNVPAAGDAAAGEVVMGSDTRLTNARTPSAHAASHGSGNTDPINIAESQVTNLAADLAAKADASATTTALAGKQPLDSDLTTIAGLTATTDNVIQSVAGAWASRTPAQVKTALAIAESDVTNLVTDLAAKQPLDSDLTTIAGLTATTDNIIMAVASAWASRTPAQVKTALAIAQADVSGLVAALALLAPLASPALTGTATAVNLTASGRLMISPDTITISANHAATDASLGNYFKISANAAFTLDNPTNPTDGQRITWQITQDATGTRVMTLDTAFAFGTDITAAVLTTTANKCDFLGAIYDSTAAKWRIVSFVKGY